MRMELPKTSTQKKVYAFKQGQRKMYNSIPLFLPL